MRTSTVKKDVANLQMISVGRVALAIALVLVVAVALLYGLTAMNRGPFGVGSPPSASATPSPTTSPSPSPTAAPTAIPSPVSLQPVLLGGITGRFAYGSDFIPPVTVYAISTTDPRVWYSVAFAGFGNPPRPTLPPGQTEARYTITGVAPGTYWVVAYRTDALLPDPGYYSRQVECQRTRPSGPCPDVGPAMVTVAAGQTASGIDVVTWGTQPQPSPTLPPRPTPR